MALDTAASARIGILVVNYFSAGLVAQLLGDLAGLPQADRLYVSLVDNSVDPAEAGSLNALAERYRAGFARCVVTASNSNTGYAAGNNLASAAIADAKVDAMFVVNPDVRVVVADFADALATLRRDPHKVLVAPTSGPSGASTGVASMSLLTGRSLVQGERSRIPHPSLTYPEGHFFGMATSLWESAGGLDEAYFLYCEEIDFILRNQIERSAIHACKGIALIHTGAGTTGSSLRKSKTTQYHANRSRVILFRRHRRLRKYLPLMLLVRLCYSLIEAARSPFSFAAARGIIDGLLAAPVPERPGTGE